ncbi:hypothetical protein EVAR_25915_1 [Eumeta japonica]|uniref:Uncharacterized protein n=1 Tax=Eumeta variegata TaxID=151549 RepID=A0A4C1W3Y9_EUMVA|nr:hypothetical protein EVAR_25915_1 [Eumeta japonica]
MSTREEAAVCYSNYIGYKDVIYIQKFDSGYSSSRGHPPQLLLTLDVKADALICINAPRTAAAPGRRLPVEQL